MCLSSVQDDGTSHSWNLASKEKCSSVIFDRLLCYRVSIFVQISRNKLGAKIVGCFGPFSVAGFVAGITAVVCMIAVVPFFPMGRKKMVCLYKSRLTPKSLSLEVCSGRPGRVRLRLDP